MGRGGSSWSGLHETAMSRTLSWQLSPRKAKGARAGACLGSKFVQLCSECSSSAVLSSGVRHLSFVSSFVFDVACSASDLSRACRPVAPDAPG